MEAVPCNAILKDASKLVQKQQVKEYFQKGQDCPITSIHAPQAPSLLVVEVTGRLGISDRNNNNLPRHKCHCDSCLL